MPWTSERVLAVVRAAAGGRLLVDHAFPDQVGLDALAEELVAQGQRADLLVGAVDDVDVHYFLPFFFSGWGCGSGFLAIALRMTT